MISNQSFGDWLRTRRRDLDLTQEELAQRVGCSAITLRKLEAEERRPSKQIAERLAAVLNVAPDERPAFLHFARGDPFAGPADSKIPDLSSSQQATRHNLPLQLTSFIGREQEIGEVKRLLSQPDGARLLTLTGPGGTGKTRLALQVASALVAAFPDGVWLVELAPLADPALVAQTVAAVVEVREQADRAILATLIDAVRGKTAMLILDNCEHLIVASAQFAEAVLQTCPNVRILATSRELLGVAGEQALYVPTLSKPEPEAAMSVEDVMGYEAVRLFVERAVVVSPAFALTRENVSLIAQICKQLDGIPLALELAAARLRMLPVEQIAARLDDRFQLLTGGNRTALPRHQTLEALIDWSHELLPAAEQVLLRRLAVFAGGWTLEAAEAVGIGDEVPAAGVLGLLGHLINKSLVVVDTPMPGKLARYRMLETIRQFARAKLTASGETNAVRHRQALYYMTLVETRPGAVGWLLEIENEIANLREALSWIRSAPNGADLLMRLIRTAGYFWYFSGYWSEGRAWLEGALVRPEVVDYPEAQADILLSLGQLLGLQGDYAAGESTLAHSRSLFQRLGDIWLSTHVLRLMGWPARERGDAITARLRLEESLAIFRELRSRDEIAEALNPLGEVLVMQEDALGARRVLEESLALSRELGNTNAIGWALNHLGHVAQLQGEYGQATRLHEESLAPFRELGAQYLGIAWAHQGLAETALAQGNGGLAAAHFIKALTLFRDLGDRAGVAWCLAGLAGVAALEEEPERAAWLWGAAEAFRQSIGARTAPVSRATHERLMAATREQLGEAAFAAAWAEGQAMTLEQAIELALEAE